MVPAARRALAPLALAAATLALYARTLAHPFVFDDWAAVTENPSIRDLGNLRWIVMGSRRVLTNFSLALDWAIGGGAPLPFHATNVLLHAVSALLVWRVGRRALAHDGAALFAAALFAAHPMATETVAYVASRPALLCTVFALASLLAFDRALAGGARWLVAALVGYALALASKETAAALPLALVAWDARFGGDGTRRRLRRFHAPLVAVTALAGVARVASWLRLESGVPRPWWQQLFTQVEVLWRYLFLLAAPISQSILHTVEPVRSPLDLSAWAALAALVATTALVFARGDATVRFGWLWFLAFLLPSSALPLVHDMAEHRVYEGSVGLALIAGVAFRALAARAATPTRVGAVALLAALATATLVRERVWSSATALWADAARKAPGEWAARYALGDARREAGDCAGAVDDYRAALELRPGEPRARRNLAICLAQLGRLDDARALFLALLDEAPDDAALHFNLGVLEWARGRRDAAARAFARAVELRPDDDRYAARLAESCRDPAAAAVPACVRYR